MYLSFTIDQSVACKCLRYHQCQWEVLYALHTFMNMNPPAEIIAKQQKCYENGIAVNDTGALQV